VFHDLATTIRTRGSKVSRTLDNFAMALVPCFESSHDDADPHEYAYEHPPVDLKAERIGDEDGDRCRSAASDEGEPVVQQRAKIRDESLL
jgi:hypothetical protein